MSGNVVIITCGACKNQVQMPRADVEAAGEVKCGCGSTDLVIRDPGGKRLIHPSQRAQMQAAQGQPGHGPQFTGEGMTYKITCLSCGNQVKMDGAVYDSYPSHKCTCGSTDLKVEQPPPNTAELMTAIRQLTARCPLCRGSGWVELDDGRMFPCRVCQGV